jgi:hypothetical protein
MPLSVEVLKMGIQVLTNCTAAASYQLSAASERQNATRISRMLRIAADQMADAAKSILSLFSLLEVFRDRRTWDHIWLSLLVSNFILGLVSL